MPIITVIAHNIRSTHNIGAIFRTADGFGIRKIICSGYTPYPTHEGDTRLPHIAVKITKQIHKTALGAETMVPFEHYESLDEWFHLNDSNDAIPIYALEQTSHSINLRDFKPPANFALLLGEEVDGISANYLNLCEKILEIPMNGTKESFNVSVATGIALYQLTT